MSQFNARFSNTTVGIARVSRYRATLMLHIFYLGRPDVLPTGDFAVRQAFMKLYKKRKHPAPGPLTKYARRWQPYRPVASWYLWQSPDLE